MSSAGHHDGVGDHEEEGADVVNSAVTTVRPMPVELAIHWKPLRDAHYIVASLQPGDGGRRKIFIRQRVLAYVQTLCRGSHVRRVAGILVGRFFQCPNSGLDYQVIESLTDCADAGSDDLVSAIGQALKAAKQHHQQDAHVLGWYCSAPTVGPKLTGGLAAVHRSYFQNPWQTTLVVTAGAPGGAFFLYDDPAARWFYAPFYELPDHALPPEEPKPTCLLWPQYLTVDNVVAVHLDEPIPAPAYSHTSTKAPPGDGSLAPRTPIPDERSPEPPPTEPPVPPIEPVRRSYGGLLAQMDLTPADERRLTPDARAETKTHPRPDIPAEIPVERGADAIRLARPENAPMGHKHNAGLGKATRRTRDTKVRAARTDAERFIEAARSEGFVVAATFASVAKAKRAETLWVLADPDAGILLTVATSRQVLDAMLHYNMRTDELGLMRTAFPEHRDLASRTVYLRETCLDRFPERCHALRERTVLEREWRVSPIIYFLTPSEWQSLTLTPDDPQQSAYRVQMLNHERVSALPESIRHQFDLKA